MRRRAVVVALPSRSESNCLQCGFAFSESSAGNRFLCPGCGSPRPAHPDISFFEVLGLPATVFLDETQLHARYVAASRQVHPDRFATRDPQARENALRWSTLVNRAYQTLRNRAERVRYFLELRGIDLTKASTQPPLDLAETFFELDDMDSSSAKAAWDSFEKTIQGHESELEAAWNSMKQNAAPVSPERMRDFLQRSRLLTRLRTHFEDRKRMVWQ